MSISAGHRAGLGDRPRGWSGGLQHGQGPLHQAGHGPECLGPPDGEHGYGRVFRVAASGPGRGEPAGHPRRRGHHRGGRPRAHDRVQVRRGCAVGPGAGAAQRGSGHGAASGADGRGESRRADLSPRPHSVPGTGHRQGAARHRYRQPEERPGAGGGAGRAGGEKDHPRAFPRPARHHHRQSRPVPQSGRPDRHPGIGRSHLRRFPPARG